MKKKDRKNAFLEKSDDEEINEKNKIEVES
jgi:hypothetical protein